MLDFIYNTPTTVYFGKDKELETGKIISSLGYKKIMIQYGKESVKKSGLLNRIIGTLNEQGIEYVEVGGVEPNPKLEFVREAIIKARNSDVQMILAVGGGSVIDSAKFTALGVPYDGDVWDFPMGKAVPKSALPVGCVLTMSAAGSEMSSSAVLSNLSISKKKGCTTELNRCKFAICNPELTYSVGKYQTACGIVDIMAHTMERYFTVCPPTPLTDRISESILKSVVEAGRKVIENPNDYDGRATLMWASSLSHNGLTGCGRENALAVHQLEHAVSGEFDKVAHGAGLAVLFPAWADYVVSHNVERFSRFAREVFNINGQDSLSTAKAGIEAMREFFCFLEMPTKLSDFGISESSIDRLSDLCTNGKTRTIKSYVNLGFNEVKEIFLSCL